MSSENTVWLEPFTARRMAVKRQVVHTTWSTASKQTHYPVVRNPAAIP